MIYIAKERFNKPCLCKWIDIPAGAKCDFDGTFIRYNGDLVCTAGTEYFNTYFEPEEAEQEEVPKKKTKKSKKKK